MAPNLLCCRREDPERRNAPPKYAQLVSVSDKVFFLRILLRWAGSVWQMLWLDLLVFVALYTAVNLFYILHLLNNKELRMGFEAFVLHVQTIAADAPLSFLLGFFVSAVLARWWSVCMLIPWLSQPSVLLNSYISEGRHPELARKVKLNILRYMNLAWIIAMKPLSLQIYRRFCISGEQKTDFQKLQHATYEIFVDKSASESQDEKFDVSPPDSEQSNSKVKMRMDKINDDTHVRRSFGRLITDAETEIFTQIAERTGNEEYEGEFWLPLQWATRILKKARQCGLILSDIEFTELIILVDKFRGSLGTLSIYYDINIPLVYTQVVIIAVYTFYIAEIFSSQVIKGEISIKVNGTLTEETQLSAVNNYIPIYSIFKFIFTIGWFKTAASLLNPLGDGEQDLPTNLILDFNLAIAIQSGDARDSVYPLHLTSEGNPVEQLHKLGLFPPATSPNTEGNAEAILLKKDPA